tara:strand:- start:1636 stop:2106 length:471 start_codon:yes stop_codon:yes gene_type:complete
MGLTDRNKAVIDRLFVNGFNRTEAWQSQYLDSQNKYAAISCYQMLEKVEAKDYYQVKHDEFKQTFNIDKHILVEKLLHQVDTFDAMIALAGKDNLSDNELDKLERLSSLIKGSDIMKAKDMICKLIDAYTPTKIEVTNQTFRVGFDLDEDDYEPNL